MIVLWRQVLGVRILKLDDNNNLKTKSWKCVTARRGYVGGVDHGSTWHSGVHSPPHIQHQLKAQRARGHSMCIHPPLFSIGVLWKVRSSEGVEGVERVWRGCED